MLNVFKSNSGISVLVTCASTQLPIFQKSISNDPEYIFRVPDSPVLIRAKKSKYLNPVLPNITRFGRRLPNIRRTGTKDYEIEWLEDVDLSSMSSEFKDIAAKLNTMETFKNTTTNSTKGNTNDWSVLGLDGWEGDIQSPSEYIRQTRFTKRIVVEDKEPNATGNFSNSDIFIGRSNNPFGHSTKLELR